MDNVIDRIYDAITFSSRMAFILTRDRVAFFADIIKVLTMFIIIIYKDSRKVKTNRYYVSRYNLYLYFLI